MTQPCPCGSKLPFSSCCSRYLGHFDDTPAPDAEALMRSRYCAFVLLDRDYLLATWHESRRPADLELDAGAKWLGLEVRKHKPIDDSHAEVEFVARYRVAGPSPLRPFDRLRASGTQGERNSGRAARIHERSRFVRENGRWYYLDGDMP